MVSNVVPRNVYALSDRHCGPHSNALNNRFSIGMIGCWRSNALNVDAHFQIMEIKLYFSPELSYFFSAVYDSMTLN